MRREWVKMNLPGVLCIFFYNSLHSTNLLHIYLVMCCRFVFKWCYHENCVDVSRYIYRLSRKGKWDYCAWVSQLSSLTAYWVFTMGSPHPSLDRYVTIYKACCITCRFVVSLVSGVLFQLIFVGVHGKPRICI